MELKITIAFDERTHETLGRLADALSKEMAVTVAQPGTTQNDTHGNAQKTPVNGRKAKAEQEPDKTANVAQSEENASHTGDWTDNMAFCEPVEPKKTEKPAKPITQEELRGIAADVRTKTGTAEGIKQVLAKYGAKKLSEVPEDKYADFAHDLEELL
jgi:hypothetical protein